MLFISTETSQPNQKPFQIKKILSQLEAGETTKHNRIKWSQNNKPRTAPLFRKFTKGITETIYQLILMYSKNSVENSRSVRLHTQVISYTDFYFKYHSLQMSSCYFKCFGAFVRFKYALHKYMHAQLHAYIACNIHSNRSRQLGPEILCIVLLFFPASICTSIS